MELILVQAPGHSLHTLALLWVQAPHHSSQNLCTKTSSRLACLRYSAPASRSIGVSSKAKATNEDFSLLDCIPASRPTSSSPQSNASLKAYRRPQECFRIQIQMIVPRHTPNFESTPFLMTAFENPGPEDYFSPKPILLSHFCLHSPKFPEDVPTSKASSSSTLYSLTGLHIPGLTAKKSCQSISLTSTFYFRKFASPPACWKSTSCTRTKLSVSTYLSSLPS